MVGEAWTKEHYARHEIDNSKERTISPNIGLANGVYCLHGALESGQLSRTRAAARQDAIYCFVNDRADCWEVREHWD